MNQQEKDWSSGFVSAQMTHKGEPFSSLQEIYISSSGFCRLFKAERYGRFHVLKALKVEYANQPFAEQMLHKEFVISYPLDHPHICRTIGEETVEGLGHVLVQEYVDGANLRQFMEQGELTPENARSLLLELCSALNYLHSRQIIHRDLKPENIMITRNGQHVKLIDFNLSDSDRFSQLKESAGTRFYMAPEVVKGEESTDQRADIYSLGIMIGEMAEILNDKALNTLAHRCTKRRREERLPSAEAVVRELTGTSRWKIRPWLAAILILLVAGTAIYGYSCMKGEQREPALYPTYGNYTLGESCRQLLEGQQQQWLQMEGESLTLPEMKRDSLKLIHQLRRALDEEFPLPEQRRSKLYSKQWELIEYEVDRIYKATIRSKRPQ